MHQGIYNGTWRVSHVRVFDNKNNITDTGFSSYLQLPLVNYVTYF